VSGPARRGMSDGGIRAHRRPAQRMGGVVLKGFRNFLMQGDLIVVAVGLVVALAFSTLVKAFTDSIITPLVSAAGGGTAGAGLGWTINGQRINLGVFISAAVYFVILMAVVYFVIVVPYRASMARQGRVVFAAPAPTRSCPSCQSDGIPVAAARCRYCGSELTAAA
jgi:large conductance mechanosensitive channel